MKNLFIASIALLSLTIVSCKKDRIEQDSYEPMDEFFNENKPEEQEFTISNENGNQPIKGKDSTEVYIHSSLLQDANGNTPALPYKVKLIELYTYYDMIMYRMPSTSNSIVTETAGDIKVTAWKDDKALSLKPGKFFASRLNGPYPYTANKMVYQGDIPNDVYSNWNVANDGSSVKDSSGKCMMILGKLGWNMGANSKSFNGSTDITFNVKGTGGEHINLFVCMENFHGLIKGNNLAVKNVPVGETVTIVAMAKNQDKKYVLHQQKSTVTTGMTIDLKMEEKSKDDLLKFLKGL